MPTEYEVLHALDLLRQLILAPLPGARQRKEMFLEIYRVLHKVQPSHDLDARPEPQKEDDGDDLDLPFLDRG